MHNSIIPEQLSSQTTLSVGCLTDVNTSLAPGDGQRLDIHGSLSTNGGLVATTSAYSKVVNQANKWLNKTLRIFPFDHGNLYIVTLKVLEFCIGIQWVGGRKRVQVSSYPPPPPL